MEIRTLRYFLAVAYEGNITRAAEALYIAQPSLSRQIQLLEEELGCKLFVRKRHSVELTPEGLELRSRAAEAVEMIDHIKQEFSERDGAEATGDVRIAAAETSGMRTVAQATAQLRHEHPRVRIHLTTGDETVVSDLLDKGLVDFGVFCEPAHLVKYHSRRLPELDTWGVLMRTDDPLARNDAVTPADFSHRPTYVSAQQNSTDHETSPFRNWMGRRRGRFVQAGTYDLVRNEAAMVAATGELGLTFEELGGYTKDDLVFRPLSPTLRTASFFAWKRGRTFSDAARIYLDLIKAHLVSEDEQ